MRQALLIAVFGLLLATGASALTINQPTNATYDGAVTVNITENRTVDELSFAVDNTSQSCTNCSSLTDTLNLSAGNYTLWAYAVEGNDSVNASVDFSVVFETINNETNNETPMNLTVLSPEERDYYGAVWLNVTTQRPVTLEYYLSGDAYDACTNCTEYSELLNLSDGNYSVTVVATDGNESVNETVNFTVRTPEGVVINILSPENKEYEGLVPLNVTTNIPVNLSYHLKGDVYEACNDCTAYDELLNLSDDHYLLTVFATNENETVNASVAFEVERDDDNHTYVPNRTRYGLGLNKLPQLLEAGEISDEELAAILREERVNPGVINRLTKTGLLGEESIDAIIEYQRTPPGIFKKVLGWFGFEVRTAKDVLAVEYNLTVDQEAALVTDEDINEQTSERLQTRLREHREKAVPPGQAKRERATAEVQERSGDEQVAPQTAGSPDEWVPPGQAKKAGNDVSRSKADSNPGEPPGLAKKAFDAGSQRGRGKAVGKQR